MAYRLSSIFRDSAFIKMIENMNITCETTIIVIFVFLTIDHMVEQSYPGTFLLLNSINILRLF